MLARLILTSAVVGFALLPRPVAADDPPGKKADPTVQLLGKLRQPWTLKGPAEVRLDELVDLIEEKHDIPVLVNEASFTEVGLAACKPDAPPLKLPRRGLNLSVESVLRNCLGQVPATFLVRRTHIEIVSLPFAVRETKNEVSVEDPSGAALLRAPLVCGIYKEKPFNEVVADLAEEYDLNVVVSPQAGDNRTAFVSVRLLNVPADNALELLAAQADLRVLRKGKAYFITSTDHATALFDEKLERERKQIEIDNLRTPLFGLGGSPHPFGGPCIPPNLGKP